MTASVNTVYKVSITHYSSKTGLTTHADSCFVSYTGSKNNLKGRKEVVDGHHKYFSFVCVQKMIVVVSRHLPGVNMYDNTCSSSS